MKRRIDYIPQPRELLGSICSTIFGNWAGEPVEPQPGDDKWAAAAHQALDDVADLLEKMPDDPPRNRYYGRKGGLRNPHHA